MTTPMSEARLKICTWCNLEKPINEYSKKRSTSDGLRYNCKTCDKNYRDKNIERVRNVNNTYSKVNKNTISIKKKEYRLKNLEKILIKDRERYTKNKKVISLRAKKYRENNKEKLRNKTKSYEKKRYDNDICYRLKKNIVSRLNLALKNNVKSKRTEELLGCTIAELKIYLENKFKDGMSWHNRADWHIDHIIPCASFDLSKEEEQKKCFHYTNLQPLWAIENLLKSNKI